MFDVYTTGDTAHIVNVCNHGEYYEMPCITYIM